MASPIAEGVPELSLWGIILLLVIGIRNIKPSSVSYCFI